MPGGEKKKSTKKVGRPRKNTNSKVNPSKKSAKSKSSKKPAKFDLKVRKVARSKKKQEEKNEELILEKGIKNAKAVEVGKEIDISSIRTSRLISQKHERDKQVLMWLGVLFFMLVISFFWLYQTKLTIEKTHREWQHNQSSIDWKDMADELGEQLTSMKKDLASVNDFSSTTIDQESKEVTDSLFETKKQASSTEELDSESLEILKKDLEKQIADKKANEGDYYFQMTKEERKVFVDKLEQVELGQSIEELELALGNSNLEERVEDKRGAFISNLHTYYVQILDKDTFNELYDEYIVLSYDQDGLLQDINKKIKK